jgi:hypothetical protein
MDWTANRTLELHTTSSEEFILTGVAAKSDFEVDSNTYHGVKVFATLHREAFKNKTQMDSKAVNVAHMRGEEVLKDGFALQGVWTLEEQNSLGEWQMLLFFALDTSKLQNGDEIVIKGDSVFYANNEEKELMSIIGGAQSNTFAHGNAFKTTYGYVPQDMSSAAAAFTDGKYDQSIWVEVTDGTLRLGVKKEYQSTNDWTIFDNFRVVYYGVQQPNAIEEIKATINSRTNDVYDLSGRLVRRQGEGLEGLKAGIYIINGKKYIVK